MIEDPRHQSVSALLRVLALLAACASAAQSVGALLVAPQQKPPATSKFARFAAPETVPAVTDPKFVTREQAEAFLQPDEPVLGLALGSEARAYSLWQLERRLVVNDRIAGRAVAITWCPFSHTAVVYARSAGDRELILESDGRLLHDALVLRDRETGALWTQADGACIEGGAAAVAGTLAALPALQTTWKVWKQEQPATLVLDKGATAITSSGYTDYYADPRRVGLGSAELKEPRMGGKALVVGIVAGSDRVAIPLDRLKRDLIVSTVADRQALAALYDPATGTMRVVRREARGHIVTLRRGFGDIFGKPTPPYLVDEETASRWDFAGRATSGRMQGHRLPLFPHRLQFWYAWQAYFPKSRVE